MSHTDCGIQLCQKTGEKNRRITSGQWMLVNRCL